MGISLGLYDCPWSSPGLLQPLMYHPRVSRSSNQISPGLSNILMSLVCYICAPFPKVYSKNALGLCPRPASSTTSFAQPVTNLWIFRWPRVRMWLWAWRDREDPLARLIVFGVCTLMMLGPRYCYPRAPWAWRVCRLLELCLITEALGCWEQSFNMDARA